MSEVNVKVLSKPETVRIEYNGVTYEQADGKAEAGDIIRITKGAVDITIGGYYFVKRIRHDGDPEIIDDMGDNRDAGFFNYEVYRKVVAEPEYREVKRKARVGERIKIVEPHISCGQYLKGDVLTVREPDASWKRSVNAEGVAVNIRHDEYVVLEPVKVPTTFEKGDKVRLIAGGGGDGLCGFDDGETCEVFDTSERPGGWTGRVGIKTESGHRGFAKPDQLEKVTEKPKPKLAPGDYAKVVKNIDGDSEFSVGDIRKVTEIDADDDELPYATRNLDGSDFIWHYAAELVKATDEEVDKAKLEAKEAAKWSAIGRKPGEYKEGDIVILGKIDGCHGLSDTEGVIAEIDAVKDWGRPYYVTKPEGVNVDNESDTWTYASEIAALICPAEQRFDRK